MNITLSNKKSIIKNADEFCTAYTGACFEKPQVAVLCENNGKILGALTGSISDFFTPEYKTLFSMINNSVNIGQIIKIAVCSDHRREGIGLSLIKSFEDYCLNNEAYLVNLTTISGGEPMLDLLYTNGYTKILRRNFVNSSRITIDTPGVRGLLTEYCAIQSNSFMMGELGKHLVNTFFTKMGVQIIKERILYTKGFYDSQEPVKDLTGKAPKELTIDCVAYPELHKKLLEIVSMN